MTTKDLHERVRAALTELGAEPTDDHPIGYMIGVLQSQLDDALVDIVEDETDSPRIGDVYDAFVQGYTDFVDRISDGSTHRHCLGLLMTRTLMTSYTVKTLDPEDPLAHIMATNPLTSAERATELLFNMPELDPEQVTDEAKRVADSLHEAARMIEQAIPLLEIAKTSLANMEENK